MYRMMSRLAGWLLLGLLSACSSGSSGAPTPGGGAGKGPTSGAAGEGGAKADAAAGGQGGTENGTGGSLLDNPAPGSEDPAGGVGGTPTEDANCGQGDFGLEKLPPDILIVLDKSLSMNDPSDPKCTAAGCSKWEMMTGAINKVVADTQSTVHWGLKFFASSSSDMCSVNPGADVGVAANTASAIADAIRGTRPSSATPTRAAETSGGDYLLGLTDTNPKFIVLATDGQPNCQEGGSFTAADDAAAEKAVANVAAKGIPTFIVGIATDGSSAEETLNKMAAAGGKPRVGAPQYYPVANTDDLVSVLGTIQGLAGTCEYPVPSTPPVPDNVLVLAEKETVPQDSSHAEGWDYTDATMGSITLYGTWCTRAKAGSFENVRILFGCAGVPIKPPA